MESKREHPILDLIHRRATAEDFDPRRTLDPQEIRELVEDATRAPSAFNIQHWRFVAVSAAEDRVRLKQAAYGQEQVEKAPVTFIVLGDPRGAERLPEIMETAVGRGAIPSGKAAAWVRMTKQIYADEGIARDEAMRSASLASMTLMLAAEARGMVAGALTGFDPEAVTREFGIEPPLFPVMLIAVGYAYGPQTARMPRLPVEEVLAFDRWPGSRSRSGGE